LHAGDVLTITRIARFGAGRTTRGVSDLNLPFCQYNIDLNFKPIRPRCRHTVMQR
jgi:hypothetical protein